MYFIYFCNLPVFCSNSLTPLKQLHPHRYTCIHSCSFPLQGSCTLLYNGSAFVGGCNRTSIEIHGTSTVQYLHMPLISYGGLFRKQKSGMCHQTTYVWRYSPLQALHLEKNICTHDSLCGSVQRLYGSVPVCISSQLPSSHFMFCLGGCCLQPTCTEDNTLPVCDTSLF